MEYRKIIDVSDNISNQPSKFKTKNWVKINDESQGTYDEVNQIRFKTYGQVYVIIAMHIYLLKELEQL